MIIAFAVAVTFSRSFRGTGRDLVEHELLRRAAAERHGRSSISAERV